MRTRKRTPTRVVVNVLDLTEVNDELAAQLVVQKEKDPERWEGTDTLKVTLTWGVVATPRGLYALNTEGVGPAHPVTDEEPLKLEVYTEGHTDEDVETFGMFPVGTVDLGPDRLRELQGRVGRHQDVEEVNLRDFVRTFGDRLDQNYEQWRRTLEVALGYPADAV